jgi:SAM-dependent methyltransferase
MEDMRRVHNAAKMEFLRRFVAKGSKVLDVGCGRGGDIHKWSKLQCTVTAIDPDSDSINECISRIEKSGYKNINAYNWSIDDIIDNDYDVVCYNFSLQYIFISEEVFKKTLKKIESCLKYGGILIGVVPDATKILRLHLKWYDIVGNTIERGPSIKPYSHKFGEMILVNLIDAPYYSNGGVPEPLCHASLLFDGFKCMDLEEWSDFSKNIHTISHIYSKFVFRKNYIS